MRNKVILVNEADEILGEMDKLKAHQENKLHRAFSVFLFSKNKNNAWQVLLQQRALEKYHCGGLWTNTCCSHPQPGESILEAGVSRLKEELGIENINLKDVGSFIYQADFDNGLSEHELDHVLVGICDENININLNPEEVADIKWCDLSDLIYWQDKDNLNIIKNQKRELTPWLEPAFRLAYCNNKNAPLYDIEEDSIKKVKETTPYSIG